MTTFSEAYAAQRDTIRARPDVSRQRAAVLSALGKALATVVFTIAGWVHKLRRNLLYLSGFGLIDYAVWSWHPLVGYAAIGVSLLILEMLSGGDG